MARSPLNNKNAYQDRIRDELNILLRKNIKDARLVFVSFTRVDMNQDYSLAKVFWDTFDSSKKEEIETALNGVASRLRSLLAQTLKVRHTPAITFIYDSQYEDELKIDKLISKDNEVDQ